MSDNLDEALQRARDRKARSTFTDSGGSDLNTMLRRAAFGGEATPEPKSETPRSSGADGGKGTPTPAPVDMNTLIRRGSRRGY